MSYKATLQQLLTTIAEIKLDKMVKIKNIFQKAKAKILYKFIQN